MEAMEAAVAQHLPSPQGLPCCLGPVPIELPILEDAVDSDAEVADLVDSDDESDSESKFSEETHESDLDLRDFYD